MVDLYAEKGIRHLAHAAGSPGVGEHNLNTNFRVTKLEDLKGKKIRTPPLTRHFIQAAGAESITLPPSEVFLAMDRKTVEGFTWPVVDGFTRYGWQNVTKYSVNFPLYRSGGSIAMNLAKWKSLSPEVQEILLKAAAETQEQTRDFYAKSLAHEQATMQKAGMEFLTLTEDEGKRWKEASENALWQYYKTIVPPQKLERARELLSKR
jgi:TRAP-type C4-dicarboxylate transport system substrate-binding protein